LEGSLPRVLHSAQLCFLRCVICSKTLTQSQLLNLMSWLNFNSRCCRGESRTGMDCIMTHFWGKFDIHSFIRQAHCFAVSANWEMVLRLAWIYTREPWGHRWGEWVVTLFFLAEFHGLKWAVNKRDRNLMSCKLVFPLFIFLYIYFFSLLSLVIRFHIRFSFVSLPWRLLPKIPLNRVFFFYSIVNLSFSTWHICVGNEIPWLNSILPFCGVRHVGCGRWRH
jgi:hypothetical protein